MWTFNKACCPGVMGDIYRNVTLPSSFRNFLSDICIFFLILIIVGDLKALVLSHSNKGGEHFRDFKPLSLEL